MFLKARSRNARNLWPGVPHGSSNFLLISNLPLKSIPVFRPGYVYTLSWFLHVKTSTLLRGEG